MGICKERLVNFAAACEMFNLWWLNDEKILSLVNLLPIKLNRDVIDGESLDLFDNWDKKSLRSVHCHTDVVVSLVRDRLLLRVKMTVKNCLKNNNLNT